VSHAHNDSHVAGKDNQHFPYLYKPLQCQTFTRACAYALQNAMRCITPNGDDLPEPGI